jgi:hypothetical protein
MSPAEREAYMLPAQIAFAKEQAAGAFVLQLRKLEDEAIAAAPPGTLARRYGPPPHPYQGKLTRQVKPEAPASWRPVGPHRRPEFASAERERQRRDAAVVPENPPSASPLSRSDSVASVSSVASDVTEPCTSGPGGGDFFPDYPTTDPWTEEEFQAERDKHGLNRLDWVAPGVMYAPRLRRYRSRYQGRDVGGIVKESVVDDGSKRAVVVGDAEGTRAKTPVDLDKDGKTDLLASRTAPKPMQALWLESSPSLPPSPLPASPTQSRHSAGRLTRSSSDAQMIEVEGLDSDTQTEPMDERDDHTASWNDALTRRK